MLAGPAWQGGGITGEATQANGPGIVVDVAAWEAPRGPRYRPGDDNGPAMCEVGLSVGYRINRLSH
jgi:hypothetical protein